MAYSLNIWSAFVTLFVTIGPIETAAVFASLTAGIHHGYRRSLAARAAVIAGVLLVLFMAGGGLALQLLHVSLPAFRIAGGILLFLQALTLTFAKSGLSSISHAEHLEAEGPGDIAVFPLAFPVIASPGSLAATVLLMGSRHSVPEAAVLAGLLLLCLWLTYLAMRLSAFLGELLGKTGTDVIGRISGVMLAALAVQFVIDGTRQALA